MIAMKEAAVTHRITPLRTVVPEVTGTFETTDLHTLARAALNHGFGKPVELEAAGEFVLTEDIRIVGRMAGGVVPAGTLVRLTARWPYGHSDGDAEVTLSFRAPVKGSMTNEGASVTFGDSETPRPE
ncbi:MAG: hypothetical protein WBA46_18610 [Thermomicrobiales bacterium]